MPKRNYPGFRERICSPNPIYVTVFIDGAYHVKRVDVYPSRTVAVFRPQVFYKTSRGFTLVNQKIVKPKMLVNHGLTQKLIQEENAIAAAA